LGGRAGAVVAVGVEGAMSASVHVRPGGDFVARRDDAETEPEPPSPPPPLEEPPPEERSADPSCELEGASEELSPELSCECEARGATSSEPSSEPEPADELRSDAALTATGSPAGALVPPAGAALDDASSAGASSAGCSWGRADAGGVSVVSPLTPITFQVAGPTMLSTANRWRAWSRSIAASVWGPNSPSTSRRSAP